VATLHSRLETTADGDHVMQEADRVQEVRFPGCIWANQERTSWQSDIQLGEIAPVPQLEVGDPKRVPRLTPRTLAHGPTLDTVAGHERHAEHGWGSSRWHLWTLSSRTHTGREYPDRALGMGLHEVSVSRFELTDASTDGRTARYWLPPKTSRSPPRSARRRTVCLSISLRARRRAGLPSNPRTPRTYPERLRDPAR
jgi:hypothetical protein